MTIRFLLKPAAYFIWFLMIHSTAGNNGIGFYFCQGRPMGRTFHLYHASSSRMPRIVSPPSSPSTTSTTFGVPATSHSSFKKKQLQSLHNNDLPLLHISGGGSNDNSYHDNKIRKAIRKAKMEACLSNISTVWSNFCDGILHVHENYLPLWWKVLTMKFQISLILHHGIAIIGSFTPPVVLETESRFLWTILRFVGRGGNTISRIWNFPLRIVASVPFGIWRRQSPITIIFPHLANKEGTTTNRSNIRPYNKPMNQITTILGTMIIPPIAEEVLARFAFEKQWQLWSSISQRIIQGFSKNHHRGSIENHDHNGDDNDDESAPTADEEELLNMEVSKPKSWVTQGKGYSSSSLEEWLGQTPWVLVSSVLYASCLMGYYQEPDMAQIDATWNAIIDRVYVDLDEEPLWMQTWLPKFGRGLLCQKVLTLAVTQFTTSMFCSLNIFSPMYQQGGLAASIGAHLAWSLAGLTARWQIPFRLLARVWT